MNAGEEMFYTQSRLAVAGRPQLCSLTFALINSSVATQGSNMSLFSEVNSLHRPSVDVHARRRRKHALVSAQLYRKKYLKKKIDLCLLYSFIQLETDLNFNFEEALCFNYDF